MQKRKRASAKKTTTKISAPSQQGVATMSLKYAITTIVVVCAVILGVLAAMGPKTGLQTPPIEEKAMKQIQSKGFLSNGETLEAYKATSYYSYKCGVVVTNQRVFAFYNDELIKSIPLNKITMVIVKDTELGHQEVLVSAQARGVIGVYLTRNDAKKFVELLNVPASMVQNYTKHSIKEVKTEAKENATKAPVPSKM